MPTEKLFPVMHVMVRKYCDEDGCGGELQGIGGPVGHLVVEHIHICTKCGGKVLMANRYPRTEPREMGEMKAARKGGG